MTAPVLHVLLDGEGRLIDGDPAFAEINAAAGGAAGRPLASPALATVVRLAGRLGTLISREVTFADGDRDIDAWARVQPEQDGLRLTLSQIRARPALRPMASPVDPLPVGDWQWETDHAGRITFLSAGAGVAEGTVLGRPLQQLLHGLADVPEASAFQDREASMTATGDAVAVSAVPRLDREGRFAGYRGVARRADVATAPDAGLDDVFTTRLDRALRAPLGQIIANADSINAQADGPVSEDYAGYAADIANAGRHLMSLIDDLVDLEAIERPDFEIAVEPIDLADLARRAAGLFAVRAADAEIALERPGEGTSLMARGDFRRTLQILVNLIGNAIRYAPRGSTVTVAVAGDSSHGWVSVADTGKGVAAANHELVFEKFGRVDPGEPGGNGLGLYIARKLARAMTGDLTLESAAGEGARFILTLPA